MNKKQTTKDKVNLVTRTNFAKMAAVSPSNISKAINKTGLLTKAVVGKKIDANHPDAVLYLARNKARLEAKKRKSQNVGNNFLEEKLDGEIEPFLDLSLREVVELFGTDEKFSEWLKAAKIIEDIKEKQIKNNTSLNELIPREYVRTHLIAFIETLSVRLLSDSPRTIAARVLEAKESGESREKIEKLIGELIGAQIKGTKLRIRRSLHE